MLQTNPDAPSVDTKAVTKCPLQQINSVSDEILAYIRKKLKLKYGDKKPLRGFHAKTIGLVKAVLTVEKLPEELRVGLFKHPREFDAWVRFSNASSTVSADGNRGVRGMAIKILEVDGERFMNDKLYGNTQDIILFTSRVSIPGRLDKQPLIPKAGLGKGLEKFGAIILGLLYTKLKGALAFKKGQIKTPNILEELYFSATPYRFGNRAVKWHARPLKTVTDLPPEIPTPDFLRDRLIDDLNDPRKELAFALLVQFHQHDQTEPIEDPSVEWTTPFFQVATITLVKNDNIDTPARKEEDIQMNFSPGYAIKDHAPLGGVNQVRLTIYEQLAKERRAHP